MLKIGKLVKSIDSSSSVLEIYSFDLGDISWSIPPEKADFTIEKKLLGQGGFRKAFKATSRSHKFSGTTWMVKFYLPKTCEEIESTLNQTLEQHTKKIVQMHALAKNFAEQLTKEVHNLNVSLEFGKTLKYNDIFFARLDDEFVTLEEFVEGVSRNI